jgi:hypothetical protein
LENDSVFLGEAEVILIPSEGSELVKTATETPGETLFSGLADGRYTLEARAPGFLSLRMGTVIEGTQHERILYLVMKRRPMTKRVDQSEEESSEAERNPAKVSSFMEVSKEAASPDTNFWMDHDLKANVPPVDPGVQCPAPKVMNGVGEQMKEFVSNLEKFTATEELTHLALEPGKKRRSGENRRFAYVVTVTRNRLGTFLLEEYRDGSMGADKFPNSVATNGLPGLGLIFHPAIVEDFQFTCEGLGQTGGQAAWQVHFAQRPDKSVRARAYVFPDKTYGVYMDGRAWIDPGNYQVLRLETELQKPIPEIGLTKEHIVIQYAPVEFRTQKTEIWLPQKGELYVERKGHRYYRRHTFSNFMLFNVETTQNIQAPKGSYSFTNTSDRDIVGALTVVPRETVQLGVVRMNFVVPARGRVLKLVGPGKDINLPITAVASATFVHDGKTDSLIVEASLTNETTLDLIPETIIAPTP